MRKLLAVIVSACVVASFLRPSLSHVWAAPAAAAKTPAAKPTTGPSKKADRIAALEAYYATLYAKPLAEKNRLSQLVGVVSLARVGGDPIAKKLVTALDGSDVLVGQIAWEAIHARQASLSESERDKWLAGGLDIARRGGFPGSTIAPLLAALSSKPSAGFKVLPEVLARVATENDPTTDDGKPAIDAARDAIASWRDPRAIQVLLARLQKSPKLAPRVAAMLSGLPDAPEATDDAVKLRATWERHLRVSKMTPPTTHPTYAGVSTFFPEPEKIEDPDDKKWRKDLELPKLDLDSVDLAVCIDATGSMIASNEYVTAYVETVMRVMRLMSDQVRGGAVYYRHETDEALMLKCCKDAPKQPDNFRTRVLPFVNDPKVLLQQMHAQKLAGKTGHGEDRKYSAAWAGGIATAMKGMQWNPKGKRVIACTGDDKATPGSEKALVALAEKAKAEGYLLLFVVRDEKAFKAVEDASKAATGLEPIIYKSDIDKMKEAGSEKDKKAVSPIEGFKGTAFEQMTTRVVELSLPEGYRDRVKPLLAAVLPILEAQDAAAKASKGMEK